MNLSQIAIGPGRCNSYRDNHLDSAHLCAEFGKGYSARNLREFHTFYLVFPNQEIWHTRVPNLREDSDFLRESSPALGGNLV